MKWGETDAVVPDSKYDRLLAIFLRVCVCVCCAWFLRDDTIARCVVDVFLYVCTFLGLVAEATRYTSVCRFGCRHRSLCVAVLCANNAGAILSQPMLLSVALSSTAARGLHYKKKAPCMLTFLTFPRNQAFGRLCCSHPDFGRHATFFVFLMYFFCGEHRTLWYRSIIIQRDYIAPRIHAGSATIDEHLASSLLHTERDNTRFFFFLYT